MMKGCIASFPSFILALNPNMKTTEALSSGSSSSFPSSSFDPDWAWLPQELLFLVFNKLLLLDMIRFGSVCRQWRSVAKERFEQLNLQANMHFIRNLPMLLLFSAENNARRSSLFSIVRREIYDLNLLVPYSKRYCGSSHGWLIILDDVSFVISLVNPFYFGNSKGIIHLPPFIAALDASEESPEDFDCKYFVSKAILSSDPITSPNDYAVMLIYGDRRILAFWKSGNTHWTYINVAAPVFCDLIYSQGHVLAVNLFGEVYSCEVDVRPLQFNIISGKVMAVIGSFCRRYIVELPDGTLLQVVRFTRKCACERTPHILCTVAFFFYKLVDTNGTKSWIVMLSLGEGALFLGDNSSLYVIASQIQGCRPNSAYFTDDFQESDTELLKRFQFADPGDIGIYHLDDGTIRRIYYPLPDQCRSTPPIWILPTI